ncbi:AAA family ATPase, partial [Bacillus cereus]
MKLQIVTQKATQFEPDISLLAEKEAGRQAFIKRFPLHSLSDLTLEEYANTKAKDCFNYWLERKNILGGIGGANSAKFGIYLAKTGEYCKGYG